MTKTRVLWIIQILLAMVFLFAGGVKLVLPVDALTKETPMLSAGFLRFVGVCELLGAIGLILPGLLRIQPRLTPLARGADRNHDRRNGDHRNDYGSGHGAHATRGRPASGVHRLRAMANGMRQAIDD